MGSLESLFVLRCPIVRPQSCVEPMGHDVEKVLHRRGAVQVFLLFLPIPLGFGNSSYKSRVCIFAYAHDILSLPCPKIQREDYFKMNTVLYIQVMLAFKVVCALQLLIPMPA